ncbi:MAG TPA: 4-(cytidine 5'-diphospho)-2-C-methyl-D-erythritol kinase [Nocardioidaceae bacterium]|nr:4-(cytidine 5'-diphospho)-2-C-methyl-D-erythritol kinase [Nocardioidaceae bacterium]
MRTSTARAPAKINLSLGVGSIRPDGYHPLATVYQAVGLCDEVRAGEVADDSVSVRVHSDADQGEELTDVPVGIDNIAVRAALLLREAAGIDDGVALSIRKSIPVSGGMAGGSADAAGALVACDDLWGLHTPKSELERIAAQLGSDVPFCLAGGNAIGSGRGEVISPVLARGSYQWVFALAHEGMSTAKVYAEYDRLVEGTNVAEPEVDDELMAALRAGDAAALGAALSNDLQDAAIFQRPELAETLAIGEECGALGAQLSGSGPTAMFLASDEQHAMDIAVALASAQVAADVVQATGPVVGARLV